MLRIWSAPNTKDAYRLSWISLLATVLAAIAGLLMYLSTGSSLALVFGLENCVDFLSSAVVLWRFFAPAKIDPELEKQLERREKRASIGISFVLIILGVGIFAAAVADLLRGEEEQENVDAFLAIAFISVLVFGTLTAFKFRYATALDSPSLYKDGLCSLIGTVLGTTLFVNTLIIRQASSFWWIDPVVSLICGIASSILGVMHLYEARHKDNLPIFTMEWWLTSQGEGQGNSSKEPEGLKESVPVDTEMETIETEGEVV